MIQTIPFSMNPWTAMDTGMDLDRWLYRMLRATADRVGDTFPKLNVYSGNDGEIVDAELPGIDPAKVEVSVEGSTLTIKGKRTDCNGNETTFERCHELPFLVAEEGVSAKSNRGVLRITLPKAPAAKLRNIQISEGETK